MKQSKNCGIHRDLECTSAKDALSFDHTLYSQGGCDLQSHSHPVAESHNLHDEFQTHRNYLMPAHLGNEGITKRSAAE
jgi:hypothetical protein